jgi:predicted metal-dependent hydrolase
MSSIIKEVVIIRTKLQKQKGVIGSKLYRGIHIVCNLLSRKVEPEILTIH